MAGSYVPQLFFGKQQEYSSSHYAASGEVPEEDVVDRVLQLARSALTRGANDRAILLLEAMERWPLAEGSRAFDRYQRLRREAGLASRWPESLLPSIDVPG